MYSGKNILVTGGAGFIGSNLIKALLQAGANVRATIHDKQPAIDDPGVEYLELDLTEHQACQAACKDMELVFLCAAQTSGAAVMESRPLAHLTPNLIMNARMLEAAHLAGVRKCLFISSNTVYPAVDYAVREDEAQFDFFEKYFIVAWMKRFSEIMCQMYDSKIKHPMKTVVVRPANSYGPYDKFDWVTSHVLPALIRKVVERHTPIKVWGDGMDVKDFIYVHDLVEGMMLAMEKLDGFEPVNLASGKEVVLGEVLKMIMEIDGYRDAEIVYQSDKPSMIPRRLISTSKAKNLLGFTSRTSLRDGLAQTISWYRSTI
jgi:GDP-L-fucose synthase